MRKPESVPKADKLAMCKGCRENYYNGEGASECWSLKTAKVVKRWRLGWWTRPDERGAFTEVVTLNCHRAPGKYAHQETLPPFAVAPVRLAHRTAAQDGEKGGGADA